jgi:tripartite-type tricarboxylate transporter receptor subunit TctC
MKRIALLAALSVFVSFVNAQAWPSKPVRMIVTF